MQNYLIQYGYRLPNEQETEKRKEYKKNSINLDGSHWYNQKDNNGR